MPGSLARNSNLGRAYPAGLDIPDVRGVAHFSFTGGAIAVAQEWGRAGRDGGKAHTLSFVSPANLALVDKWAREPGHLLLRQIGVDSVELLVSGLSGLHAVSTAAQPARTHARAPTQHRPWAHPRPPARPHLPASRSVGWTA